MPDPEISAILQALERYSGTYEREAVDAAIAHREEITPYLIESLEKLAANPTQYLEDLEYYLYIYALMLLGHLRETRAHESIVKLFGLPFPGDGLFELFGDITTANLPIILFNTCGGSFDLIKSLVLNRQADEFVRGSAAQALVYGVAAGQLPRQEALTFFSTLFTGDEAEPSSAFWGLIGNCILDLQPQELAPLIKEADEKGLLDGVMFDDDDVSKALTHSVDGCLKRIRQEMERDSLDDPHYQMSSWSSFQNNESFPSPPLDPIKTKGKKGNKNKRKTAKASRRKNRR
ncbi:MAG: DUF1186 domain-containing protein [Deltaproteobacteria bacterium]|nr:DUF1186 domain-containing protein [Deltaproteobacteria bacterium]